MTVWYGVLGPKGLQQDLVAQLNREINAAMALPDVRDRLAAIGVEVLAESPEAFATTLRADAVKWSRTIRELGIAMTDA